MESVIFCFTNQLARVNKKILNDEVGFIQIAILQDNPETFAYALDGDVFRCNTLLTFSKDIFPIGNGFDFYWFSIFTVAKHLRFDNRFFVYNGDINGDGVHNLFSPCILIVTLNNQVSVEKFPG